MTFAATLAASRAALLATWCDRGAFTGELSSSALSTAVAAMAFALGARATTDTSRSQRWARRAARGHRWLAEHQNADGGFGDTVDSPSNISTTTLAWVSLGVAADDHPTPDGAVETAEGRARAWLARECGDRLDPDQLARTLRERYGKDQTFSVPILTTCALGGRLGRGRDGWARVPPLPFELAALPPQLFKWLNLRVVSYALPALIAIGQVRHHFRPTANLLARPGRALARRRTLALLRQIQPQSGGYLEAAPLTSFVAMSLIAMGLVDHAVVQHGLRFLEETVRADGSWPIDTNLDTWGTSLAVAALGPQHFGGERAATTGRWLLQQQYRTEHPFTRAAPGGWAWTDLSGGVPDGDDTPGALLALRQLSDAGAVDSDNCAAAAAAGVGWLLGLQNRDGGMPTFCKGWGRLPFDQSSPDLTAHSLRAFAAWHDRLPAALQPRVARARDRAVAFLLRTQGPDGAWVPLWFGNQAAPDQTNPLYGTARVVRALGDVYRQDAEAAALRGVEFLLRCQEPAAADDCAGFGAAPGVTPTIEETALATDALAHWSLGQWVLGRQALAERSRAQAAATAGAGYLCAATKGGQVFPAAPIGLYFARLWYSERLYPLVFTVEALSAVEALTAAG